MIISNVTNTPLQNTPPTSKVNNSNKAEENNNSKPTINTSDSSNVATSSSSKSVSNLDFVNGQNKPTPKTEYFFINGIFNDFTDAHSSAQLLADLIKQPVHLFHNPTEGLTDVSQAVGNRVFDRQTDFSRKVTNNLYNNLTKSDNNIKILAHSHGSAIMAEALNTVENRLRSEGKSRQEITNIMNRVTIVSIGAFATKNDYPTGINFTRIANPHDPVANAASVSLGGRAEDVRYRIDETRQNAQQLERRGNRELSNLLHGDLSAARRVANIIPQYLIASARRDSAETEYAARTTLRTVGRVANGIYGIGSAIEIATNDLQKDINNRNVRNNIGEYLFRDHAVNAKNFNQGYLVNPTHRNNILNALTK